MSFAILRLFGAFGRACGAVLRHGPVTLVDALPVTALSVKFGWGPRGATLVELARRLSALTCSLACVGGAVVIALSPNSCSAPLLKM